MREKIEAVLNKIRPILGGGTDLALIDFDEGIARLRVIISSCKAGVPAEMAIEIAEEHLKEELPEIKQVISA